jgi:hypothetical protein
MLFEIFKDKSFRLSSVNFYTLNSFRIHLPFQELLFIHFIVILFPFFPPSPFG